MRKVKNKFNLQTYRISNDVNGNPRYVVHFSELGLDSYESTKKTRAADLKSYGGKFFGGGFVFQSYNLDLDLEKILNILNN